MSANTLFTDHPAWHTAPGPAPTRLLRSDSGTWLATWTPEGMQLTRLDGGDDHKPTAVHADSQDLPERTPNALVAELGQLGTVTRLANPWLWDAISTAILRQVITAKQARALHRTWCSTYGTARDTPDGNRVLYLAPGPETVLALTDDQFAAIKATFFRNALRSAAQAYLAHAQDWTPLAPADLAEALCGIRRIGPWTARAAAADYSGDFSIYPHGDLAVRTWAASADPRTEWPATDKDFAAFWTAMADSPAQLHALTMLTLTRGNHACTDPDPDRLF